MKIKKILATNFFVSCGKKIAATMLASLLLFPTMIFAADWGVGVNSNGGISVGVGSNGSGAGNVWGGGGGMMGGGWVLTNPYGLPSGSLLGIVSNLLFWLLSLFSLAGIIGFVISGIFYLISAGDEDMAKKGKNGMKWSIIGILVGLSGFVIMQAVNMLLSGSSKSF